VTDPTPDQAELRAAAQRFLADLDRLIPHTTVHWAVEVARGAVGQVAWMADRIHTTDHQ
jgi:hypothetical protein